jgi:hypothetical protein
MYCVCDCILYIFIHSEEKQFPINEHTGVEVPVISTTHPPFIHPASRSGLDNLEHVMSSDKCGASRFLRHCYYSLLLLSVTVLLRVTAFAPPASTVTRTITTCLHVSDSSKNDPLTTAKRERRDEDVRRNDRKAEVVPGKTSAIPGAKDYPLNPAATTEEWMKHASKVEQQVYRYTEEGMNALKMVR